MSAETVIKTYAVLFVDPHALILCLRNIVKEHEMIYFNRNRQRGSRDTQSYPQLNVVKKF